MNRNHAFTQDTTLREIVHVPVGGTALRVVRTNEFGVSDLKIGGVMVAIPQTAATMGDSIDLRLFTK